MEQTKSNYRGDPHSNGGARFLTTNDDHALCLNLSLLGAQVELSSLPGSEVNRIELNEESAVRNHLCCHFDPSFTSPALPILISHAITLRKRKNITAPALKSLEVTIVTPITFSHS